LTITEAFAGVAAVDYGSVVAWFERLLGRPPDLHPNEPRSLGGWQRATGKGRLAKGGWLYLVADSSRAGKALLRSSWTTWTTASLSSRTAGSPSDPSIPRQGSCARQ